MWPGPGLVRRQQRRFWRGHQTNLVSALGPGATRRHQKCRRLKAKEKQMLIETPTRPPSTVLSSSLRCPLSQHSPSCTDSDGPECTPARCKARAKRVVIAAGTSLSEKFNSNKSSPYTLAYLAGPFSLTTYLVRTAFFLKGRVHMRRESQTYYGHPAASEAFLCSGVFEDVRPTGNIVTDKADPRISSWRKV